MNRLTISLRFLLKPVATNRFKIERGVFRKPIRIMNTNAYWEAKHKRYIARFDRHR